MIQCEHDFHEGRYSKMQRELNVKSQRGGCIHLTASLQSKPVQNLVMISYEKAKRISLPVTASILFIASEITLIGAGLIDFSKWHEAVSAVLWFEIDRNIIKERNNPKGLAQSHLLCPPVMALTNLPVVTACDPVGLSALGVYTVSRGVGAIGELSKITSFNNNPWLLKIAQNANTSMFATSTISRFMLAADALSRQNAVLAGALIAWWVADIALCVNAGLKPKVIGTSSKAPSPPMR